MSERRLSYRALSERTRRADAAGDGLTHGHLANLVAGRARPSPRALELIAGALEVEPDHFAEYRLAELRDHRRRLPPLPHAHRSGLSGAGILKLPLVVSGH